MPDLLTLVPTIDFLRSLWEEKFSAQERKQLLNALELLDTNEKHPSLRVHQLHGDKEGQWSASASRSLRITFERMSDGRKRMVECSRHYND